MITFLTLSEVLLILEDQIKSYGGHYLHETIPAMAAAYAFHICQNHPFIDGNKRAALTSSLVFLDINGYEFNCEDELLYTEIMEVAKGEIKKEELIQFYEKYSRTLL